MEPSQPPAKPATRRRRWRIIAGVILACVALLLWMLWPVPLNDVEKKLVGTWIPGYARGLRFITLNADRTVNYHGPGQPTGSGHWEASADSFYLDSGVHDVMHARIQRLLHGGPDRNAVKLISVEEGCFRVFVPVNGSTLEYIRVPDSSPGTASATPSRE